jgi:hypothetical protein
MSYIPQGQRVSTANSTSDLLTGDASWSGTSEDVAAFTAATVSILGSLATATGTLWFETSSDEVTWATIPRTITDITQDVPHTFLIAERYFRVRYVNDSVAQTGTFRIQTMYSNGSPLKLSTTAEGSLSVNQDVTPVREVAPIDLAMARELVGGQRSFFFFGFNSAVGTSWEDIHAGGGDINWQVSASQVEVFSSDAADTSGGLGCNSVEIHGLDASGNDQDEVIALSGTTSASSTLSYVRLNKLHNEMVGTYGGSHQGDVTCRVAGGGDTLSVMTGEEGAADSSVQYGSGEAGNGYWSVPLGKVMYITRLEVIPDVATNKTVDVILYEREDILTTTAPFGPRRILWKESAVDTSVEKEFKSHLKVKSLADVWFRAKASATSKIEVYLEFYVINANSSGK